MSRSLRPTEAEARVLIERLNMVAIEGGRPWSVRAVQRVGKRLGAAARASTIESMFAQQIAALRLPAPQREFKGAVPGRKYRLDFAWPDKKIAVEVQGQVHRIMARFKADTEKMSLLVLHGWRVLPVSGDDVRSGRAAAWITTLLGAA